MHDLENFPYHVFTTKAGDQLRKDHTLMEAGTWYLSYRHKHDERDTHVIIVPVTGVWSLTDAIYFAKMSLATKCDNGEYSGDADDYIVDRIAWEFKN